MQNYYLKHKKKICVDCGEVQFIFSKGRCRRCAVIYTSNNTRYSPDNRLKSKSGTNISPASKKRLNQRKEYLSLIKEIDADAATNREDKCYFCGKKISGRCDHHHLKGRDNNNLNNKRYIVRVHRKCHTEYHSSPVNKIDWFMGFVGRLTTLDAKLAAKELLKLTK